MRFLISSPCLKCVVFVVSCIRLPNTSVVAFSSSSLCSISFTPGRVLIPPTVRNQLICNVAVDVSDYDETCIPEPRWHCPKDLEICSQTGITLSRFMMETSRMNPELKDIESIFISLQTAVKAISNLVRTSSLKGNTGLEGGGGAINVQGEEQKKL